MAKYNKIIYGGKATGTIATVAGKYTIQNGYHDGSGTVQIDSSRTGENHCEEASERASPFLA